MKKFNKRFGKIFKRVGPPVVAVSLLVNVLLIGMLVKNKTKVASPSAAPPTKTDQASVQERNDVFAEINPVNGYQLDVTYGDLGPKMLSAGVIDFDKFKNIYEKGGQPLTQDQLDVLTQNTDKKITITRTNAYFLLNFFWALGLANQSKILTDGAMVKQAPGQTANFASTGGWSLGKGDPMNYYAKSNLISLTSDQETEVENVSNNIYRPCCDNPTSFPDCNHGMALLGMLQLMAAHGASENQMYDAAKYFNAFWFPSNYYDLALYFKNKEGESFSQIPGSVILGRDYSSASGWQAAKQWLTNKGIVQPPPQQSGGCGV